jgi:alkaline phosphatase
MGPDSTDLRQFTYFLHDAGVKIGIMTTVTIDHATPAGFYAHSADRDGYYDIAMQLPKSGFDFFGGGGFDGVNSKKIPNAKHNIYDNVAKCGYTVAYGVDDYKSKKAAGAKKMILFQADTSRVNDILPYVMERRPQDLTLKQVVASAIDFLYKPNDKGFFMMCEGGKIDWAAHDNDMAGVITETIDMDEAIKVAFEFYKKHPKETLIIVTADHETGGLTLGRTKGYTFDLSGVDVTLKKVQKEKITVDNYLKQEPVDSLSKAANIGWTTSSHTGGAVPVFAVGACSQMFSGRQNNTDLPKKIYRAMGFGELKN